MALEHGCDGFEFDVRRTSDGQLAVCHDKAFRGFVVADAPFKTLLNYSHYAIPTLPDVLERYRQRAFLNIELKVPGTEAQVLELLDRYPPDKGVLISSFLPQVLETMAHMGNKYPLGYICERPEDMHRWKDLPITHAVLHYSLLSNPLICEIAASDKKLVTWTVNDEMEMRRFSGLGIAGIISDDTRLLGRTLGKKTTTASGS
jgi:glycerophosphoryl diester phosphodiesterase